MSNEYYKGIVQLDGLDFYKYQTEHSELLIDTRFKSVEVIGKVDANLILIADSKHAGVKLNNSHINHWAYNSKNGKINSADDKNNPLRIKVKNEFSLIKSGIEMLFDENDNEATTRTYCMDSFDAYYARNTGLYLNKDYADGSSVKFQPNNNPILCVYYNMANPIAKDLYAYAKSDNLCGEGDCLIINSYGFSKVRFDAIKMDIDISNDVEHRIGVMSFKSTNPKANSELILDSGSLVLEDNDGDDERRYSASIEVEKDFIVHGLRLEAYCDKEYRRPLNYITGVSFNTPLTEYILTKNCGITALTKVYTDLERDATPRYIHLSDNSNLIFNSSSDKACDISKIAEFVLCGKDNITILDEYNLSSEFASSSFNGTITPDVIDLSRNSLSSDLGYLSLGNNQTKQISIEALESFKAPTYLTMQEGFHISQESKARSVNICLEDIVCKNGFKAVLNGKCNLIVKNCSFNSFDLFMDKTSARFEDLQLGDYKNSISKALVLKNISDDAANIDKLVSSKKQSFNPYKDEIKGKPKIDMGDY